MKVFLCDRSMQILSRRLFEVGETPIRFVSISPPDKDLVNLITRKFFSPFLMKLAKPQTVLTQELVQIVGDHYDNPESYGIKELEVNFKRPITPRSNKLTTHTIAQINRLDKTFPTICRSTMYGNKQKNSIIHSNATIQYPNQSKAFGADQRSYFSGARVSVHRMPPSVRMKGHSLHCGHDGQQR